MGWRRVVARAGVRVAKSDREQWLDAQIAAINAKCAVVSSAIGVVSFAAEPGAGTTTVTACLGDTLARYNNASHVLGVDPVRNGSLALRLASNEDQPSDLKAFAADSDLTSSNAVRSHTRIDSEGFEVLGSSGDTAPEPLEWTAALTAIKKWYTHAVVDTSPHMPAFRAVIHSLDALVVVLTTSRDLARVREMTTWFNDNGYAHLVKNAVVLVNHPTRVKTRRQDLDDIAAHLPDSIAPRQLVEIPWDRALSEGAEVKLNLLKDITRRRLMQAAAITIGSLPR